MESCQINDPDSFVTGELLQVDTELGGNVCLYKNACSILVRPLLPSERVVFLDVFERDDGRKLIRVLTHSGIGYVIPYRVCKTK